MKLGWYAVAGAALGGVSVVIHPARIGLAAMPLALYHRLRAPARHPKPQERGRGPGGVRRFLRTKRWVQRLLRSLHRGAR